MWRNALKHVDKRKLETQRRKEKKHKRMKAEDKPQKTRGRLRFMRERINFYSVVENRARRRDDFIDRF